jgi:hypothetical protein
MNELSIAARRHLTDRAARDDAFLRRLRDDGSAAILEEVGVAMPSGMTLHVIEDAANGAYIGVVPRGAVLDLGLPEPATVRQAWENMLLSVIATDEAARAELIADPLDFANGVAGRFPGERLSIFVETDADTYLVVPTNDFHDELDDSMLDLVSAGGNPNCVEGNTGSSRTNQT